MQKYILCFYSTIILPVPEDAVFAIVRDSDDSPFFIEMSLIANEDCYDVEVCENEDTVKRKLRAIFEFLDDPSRCTLDLSQFD